MKSLFIIIKSDYLQRTRSYAFLITLCSSLAIAYTFIPEPNANYSTIKIGDYIGYYNSAWFGYVSAIMTSVFLSLIGFFLVNSGINRDIETKVGQILASTKIRNFTYLISKVLSNFLVLLTIVLMVLIMSIVLFFLYNDGFPFEPIHFLKPYIFITIPSMFLISILAVVFEVLFGKYSVIQNIGFFILFFILLINGSNSDSQFALDIFGNQTVTNQFETLVKEISMPDEHTGLTMGFSAGGNNASKKFLFNGIGFPSSFIISRMFYFLFGMIIIAVIAPFFHRFNVKERKSSNKLVYIKDQKSKLTEINISDLPKAQVNYSMFPLLKTELLLLIRKGNKWLWLANLVGFILLSVVPLKVAHQIILPILWFFQVNRLSDISTKEMTNKVHYFAFTSFKPISRVFTAQIFAAFILMTSLSLPLIVRYGILLQINSILAMILGGIFIVFLATAFGILSNGKKLFEVVFFMLTYSVINGISFLDYFGGSDHNQMYSVQLAIVAVLLGIFSFSMRRYHINS